MSKCNHGPYHRVYVITDQPLRQMKINHVIEKTYIRSAQLRLPIHLQGGIFCNELHPLSFALTVCYALMLLYSFSCIKRTRTIYKSHLQSNHNSIKTRRRSAAKRTTQTKISHWDAFVLTEFFLRLPSCVPSTGRPMSSRTGFC